MWWKHRGHNATQTEHEGSTKLQPIRQIRILTVENEEIKYDLLMEGDEHVRMLYTGKSGIVWIGLKGTFDEALEIIQLAEKVDEAIPQSEDTNGANNDNEEEVNSEEEITG